MTAETTTNASASAVEKMTIHDLTPSDNESKESKNDEAVKEEETVTTPKRLDPEPSSLEEQLPHAPFENNLQYRRVCAPVHSSVLCLTIRYPFPSPLQDPNRTFAYPFEEKFYNLSANDFYFIDNDAELANCRQWTTGRNEANIDDAVQECLDEKYHRVQSELAVVAVWTKRRYGVTSFFGLHTPQQDDNINAFFQNSVILINGASPVPAIKNSIQTLFGRCTKNGITHCFGAGKRRLRKGPANETINEEAPIAFLIDSFFPDFGRRALPSDYTEHLRQNQKIARKPTGDQKPLRNLTLIIEYAIAHLQTEASLLNKFDQVAEFTEYYTRILMSVTTPEGKKALNEMGYELLRIIPFDGLPQHFPTVTHGFPTAQSGTKAGGDYHYENSVPEAYGDDCRGPVPYISPLSIMNRLERSNFEKYGLDMKWYGRTWEFVNQMHWQHQRWNCHGGACLDCTHGTPGPGFSDMHRYFLQCMVDDEVGPAPAMSTN